jgi:hypothetical protein
MDDVSAPRNDVYEQLPEPVRMVVSRKEYMWLSDGEKASLERDLTEPEWS